MAEVNYTDAMDRINEIIECIENEEIGVDELSKQVKEAVKLIQTCKQKIDKAEMEVKSVVEAFQKELEQTLIVSLNPKFILINMLDLLA